MQDKLYLAVCEAAWHWVFGTLHIIMQAYFLFIVFSLHDSQVEQLPNWR